MIRFLCPGCQKTLGVDDAKANTVGVCPACKTRFQVPDAPAPIAVTPVAVDTAPRRPPAPPPAPPVKRRPRDEDEWDIVEDDEDDDRPRRRRRRDDDDDEPVRRKKPKRARKKSRRSSAGDGVPFGSIVLGILGISVVLFLIALAQPLVGIALYLFGSAVAMAGGLWFLVVAFQDSVAAGLMCLFVPFYSLFYLIANFDELKRPFFLQLVSMVPVVLGAVAFVMMFKPPV